MDAPQEKRNDRSNSIDAMPNNEKMTMEKQDAATGLELGTFDSNPSADVLPGGRLPGTNDDERFATTRKELWSYYAYYVGNNGELNSWRQRQKRFRLLILIFFFTYQGLGPFNFGVSVFRICVPKQS
jgi:hypothetical protein